MIFIVPMDPPVWLNLKLGCKCEWINIHRGFHYYSGESSYNHNNYRFIYWCAHDLNKAFHTRRYEEMSPNIAKIMGPV